MSPPCCPPWLLRYIFIAISPACWMVDSLLAPSTTLPAAALSSKSFYSSLLACIHPGGGGVDEASQSKVRTLLASDMARPRNAPWLWLPPPWLWVNILRACMAAAVPRLFSSPWESFWYVSWCLRMASGPASAARPFREDGDKERKAHLARQCPRWRAGPCAGRWRRRSARTWRCCPTSRRAARLRAGPSSAHRPAGSPRQRGSCRHGSLWKYPVRINRFKASMPAGGKRMEERTVSARQVRLSCTSM